MRRFLILFILFLFVIASCAGPEVKRRWTKPDFRQDQFEKDRQECIDSIDKSLSSEDFQKAFDECFAKKGYDKPQDEKKPSTVVGILAIVGLVILLPIWVFVFLWNTVQ